MDILWIVDAQYDFIDKKGKLSVNAPEEVKENMRKALLWAKKNNLAIGYSLDWHNEGDVELSEKPDFKDTFPEHCIANTEGAHLISEVIDEDIRKNCLIVKKSVFNVWDKTYGAANKVEKFVLENNPSNIYIIGVATDVCVRYAALGFIDKFSNKNIIVIEDAIWGISPQTSKATIAEMKSKGIHFKKLTDL